MKKTLIVLLVICWPQTDYTWKDCDLNKDAAVDMQDFDILADNFFKSGENVPGDIDGNGIVNTDDFNLLDGHFDGPTKEQLRQEVLWCWAQIDRLEEDVSDYSNYTLNMHARINHLFAPLEPNEVQKRIEDIRQ